MVKKLASLTLVLCFLATSSIFAQEQSLAELAKKERERRESLKDQKVKVITNKDLEKLTKKEAFILPPGNPGLSQPATAAAAEGQFEPQTGQPSVVHRVNVIPPQEQPRGSAEMPASGGENRDRDVTPLEEDWKKAREYVELLTLKLNALWAEFYGMSDMKTKDYIQMQISETYEKLLKAQEEEARLRQQYESQVNRKKSESAPPIWIR
ncbi:MAG: hypothetical protein QME28_04775 [Candidatus Saccharicenans sp.]|nr:hypothetical protein [Candidatus Saccharicenans sp.]